MRHRLARGFVRSHPTYRWVCSARVCFEWGRLAEEASGGSEIPIVNAAVTRPGPVVGLADGPQPDAATGRVAHGV